MDSDAKAAKAAVRQQVRARLRQLAPATRLAHARAACARMRSRAVWRDARSVFLFAPLPDELDIWPLVGEALAAGKTVALPRFSTVARVYTAAVVRDLQVDLRAGQLGIREPALGCAEIALNRLDLVLVPGVAFDARGHRVGRGKGFYDRLLVDVRGVKCGVAFDEQIVDAVPAEPHDAPLNCILTPSRWLDC